MFGSGVVFGMHSTEKEKKGGEWCSSSTSLTSWSISGLAVVIKSAESSSKYTTNSAVEIGSGHNTVLSVRIKPLSSHCTEEMTLFQ